MDQTVSTAVTELGKEQSKEAGRPAEYPDVLNALKAIAYDLSTMRSVLHATIDFLTLKMHEENEAKNSDTV